MGLWSNRENSTARGGYDNRGGTYPQARISRDDDGDGRPTSSTSSKSKWFNVKLGLFYKKIETLCKQHINYLCSFIRLHEKLTSRMAIQMTEFAIILPVFSVVTLGGIELGYFVFQKAVLQYAAREAAVAASRDTTEPLIPNTSFLSAHAKEEAVNVVKQFSGKDIIPEDVRIGGSSGPDQWMNGRTFTLTVEQNYDPMFGSLIPFFSTRDRITAMTTMYCETCGR